MNAILGKRVSGLGHAHKWWPMQRPHLVQYIPALDQCHGGTINLELDKPLRIRRPDVVTDSITWKPGCRERFDLTKIGIRGIQDGETIHQCTGWIYGPHGSPHRPKVLHAELLAPTMPIDRIDTYMIEFYRPLTEGFYLL